MPDEREPYGDKLAGVDPEPAPELPEGTWAVLSLEMGLIPLPDELSREQALAIAMMPGWQIRQLRGGRWEPAPMTAAEFIARLPRRATPDAETAVMVLGFFEGPGPGIPPGDLNRSLIEAICRADPSNLRRLKDAYPRLVATIRLWRETEDGRDWLIALCESHRQTKLAERKAAGG